MIFPLHQEFRGSFGSWSCWRWCWTSWRWGGDITSKGKMRISRVQGFQLKRDKISRHKGLAGKFFCLCQEQRSPGRINYILVLPSATGFLSGLEKNQRSQKKKRGEMKKNPAGFDRNAAITSVSAQGGFESKFSVFCPRFPDFGFPFHEHGEGCGVRQNKSGLGRWKWAAGAPQAELSFSSFASSWPEIPEIWFLSTLQGLEALGGNSSIFTQLTLMEGKKGRRILKATSLERFRALSDLGQCKVSHGWVLGWDEL